MPSRAPRRLRVLARLLAGERAVTAATRRALDTLLREAVRALAASGYDTSVLDDRFPGWQAAVKSDVSPAVESVFLAAWQATARGDIDPTAYATRHIEAVHNRLVGVSDAVFDVMRLTLEEGRQAQESIPQLAARVDGLLTDGQRWTNRAVTVARTEVIAANNAGARSSAFATADLLGVPAAAVARRWLSSDDSRTRPSHKKADGQIVYGQDRYQVGRAELTSPGDPHGPGEEVINCRCTEEFLLPGDPDYPGDFAAQPAMVEALQTAPIITPEFPEPAAARVPTVTPAAVDPGPRTQYERMARALTLDELAMEAKRSKVAEVRRVAKAELRRRGIAASAYITEEEARTGEPLDLVVTDGTTTQALADWATTEETPVTTTAPEPVEAPLDQPTHAGIAVQALDTGRILMQQRAWDDEDAPDVRGTWEFPGGGLEDGEDPQAGAWREFTEETGLPVPEHEVTGGWRSPDGVYQAFVATVPTEAAVGLLNPDEDAAVETNPDDPRRVNPDVTAWFTAEQVQDMGAAIRPEVLRSTDWSQFAPTPEEPTMTDAEVTEVDEALEAALAVVRQAGYSLSLSEHAGMPDGPEGLLPEGEQEQPVEDATAPQVEDPDGEPFYGIIWPEGVQSGDERAIDVGATTWRDLPLPLMAQDATAPGHDGAVRVGRLDTMERDETTYAVPVIRYSGVWDTSPVALETARQVDKGVVRGISSDGDAVTVELRSSAGQTLDPAVDEFPEDGVVVSVATAARVSGGTVCSIPAFHQAYIANGTLADRVTPEPGWNEDGTPKDNVLTRPTNPEDPGAVVASAWTFTAEEAIVQPASAFVRPAALDDHPDGTPLTVTDDGRVYGHLAVWGTCHIGIDGLCQEPPASATNYAYFATGSVPTDDGNYMPTGPLVMGTGHAALTLGHRPAAAHYDNTGTCVADVVMGQDHIGIWFAGCLRPGTTPQQVYALRAAGKVSGDWREVGGNLELVAALVVNTPGFSIPRPALAASAGRAQAMVAAGMVRTPHPVETAAETQSIVDQVVAALDRRERAVVAAARFTQRQTTVRRTRAEAARARLQTRVSAGR